MNVSVHAATRTLPTGFCPRCGMSSADMWKWPQRNRFRADRWKMTNLDSDAFVFFGATGDLAYKQIFPALQAMIRRGHFDMPIIGVARSAEGLDGLRSRAHE